MGFEKGVRHRAADQNRVSLFHQRLEYADLIRNFCPTHNNKERLGRMVELFVQIAQFLFHEETHG